MDSNTYLGLNQTIKNKKCPKCHGKGYYSYDENHGKPCELCCDHGQGWWHLDEGIYTENAGKWACKAGCGAIVDNPPAIALPCSCEDGTHLVDYGKNLNDFIQRVLEENRGYKKIVYAPTGITYKVPIGYILIHGLKAEDLPTFPKYDEEADKF